MKRIVLIRHGESVWNKENRFTGWTNVDLSEKGVEEAKKAGAILKENGFHFTQAYTSYLKRAIKTLNQILDVMDLDWIPVEKSWRLNEKHYGMLQGLNKAETAEKYGDEQVKIWRRSYDVPPTPLAATDERAPQADPRYSGVVPAYLPLTEALCHTVARTLPYWEDKIFPSLMQHDDVLVAAHGNSLRGIIKVLKGISDEDIVELNLPTAVPYVFEFDDELRLVKDYFLGDPEEIKKELGDVLLHIVFYSTIGEEQGTFDLCDVANALCDKLIYRHPHVYGEAGAASAGAVVERWEELKQQEKGGNKTVLSGVPASLPTLIKAYRIQDKARGVGFDWEQPEDVWTKVDEELRELREAITSGSAEDSEAELGDFLFSVINVARKYGINPDNALERTNAKFIRRFGYVEAKAKEAGRSLRDMTLAEMDALWDEAKRLESQP